MICVVRKRIVLVYLLHHKYLFYYEIELSTRIFLWSLFFIYGQLMPCIIEGAREKDKHSSQFNRQRQSQPKRQKLEDKLYKKRKAGSFAVQVEEFMNTTLLSIGRVLWLHSAILEFISFQYSIICLLQQIRRNKARDS